MVEQFPGTNLRTHWVPLKMVNVGQFMDTYQVLRILGAALLGYFAGTIPSADIATRFARTGVDDLRIAGSGNPGATNAAALLGARWGLAVLIADMSKGSVAGVLGRSVAGSAGAFVATTAAIAGHIVPVWSRGRGGKGVATSAGACLAVFPAYFPIDAAVAIVSATVSRNAQRTIWWSCLAWIASSLVWWRLRLPNAWGPDPTFGLPLFAIAGSAMIIAKFRAAQRKL